MDIPTELWHKLLEFRNGVISLIYDYEQEYTKSAHEVIFDIKEIVPDLILKDNK